ncbi:Regulator of G-protein signaling 13 [Cytospora mali]|uniref:Regulator of G-protein signaling 13 n=1 Tax=Cytospora mali TaxID=578113 RepID=A0A194WB29_CYTMA|nr:Regulator of G-protein signaling 13 [Valsa mali]
MRNSRIRSFTPTYLTPSPSPRELSPDPTRSDDEGGGESIMSVSRPVSLAPSTGVRMPTLEEILTDTAPHPYTLGAFMAYLSQNHCLETLEFTMEADRYRLAHSQSQHSFMDNGEHVCELWQKLMQAYIQPCGSREVNLPSYVRHHLLRLPCGPSPPDPTELDEAVRIVYELMSDSVLVPFLESLSSQPSDTFVQDRPTERKSRHGRSRTRARISKDAPSPSDESGRSPKPSFLPHLSMSRRADANSRSVSSSSEPADREDLTDDSGTNSPPANEPMTPPDTPPTTDWAFSTSPGGLHRAISAHSNSWKKVGAKLGLGRKSRSGHQGSSSTSAARAGVAADPIL